MGRGPESARGALLEEIYCSFKPYLHTNHRKLVEERYCVNARFLIIMNMSFFIVG